MGHRNKGKKARAASNKAIMASVTKEMAKPRMTQSVQIKIDKQIKVRDGAHLHFETPPKEL
jgi:hypothetical protein